MMTMRFFGRGKTVKYIKTYAAVVSMNREYTGNLCREGWGRIRCMRSLMVQLEKDHGELERLWGNYERGLVDENEREEIERILSWVKEGLKTFRKMRRRGIEGVFWGRMKIIDEDVKDKEMRIKLFPLSISKEME